MDLQKLMEAMNDAGRAERSRYHLTLGAAIKALAEMDPGLAVHLDYETASPHRPHSYRGFYSDLAFEPTPVPITAERFLRLCKDALGNTYEGYKGGDFVMDEKTPLWIANYGRTGRAVIGITALAGSVILSTKQLDEY